MTIARQLAQRITAMSYEDLPPEVIYWCRIAVLDTVGVMLAGSVEEAPHMVEDVLGLQSGDGPCLLFGSDRRVRPLDAALVNGTAAHALDFDNTAKNLGGHVSAVMVPALIAAGEAFGAGGRNVLLAHAAGYEVGARIGRCVNPYHTENGWHPTSTLGVFAVASACARLLELTTDETETALVLAASLAAGIKANFGTMTKPLHAGQCARGGLLAVLLARKGYTANVDAFEHKQGFFKVFNGEGNYDAARALEGWDEWEIASPGASYKLYPCCYSTHAAVEAALNLVRRYGPFDMRTMARVDSWTAARGLAHTDRADPDSTLAAKFSVQYCVARALMHGKVVLEHFEGDAWCDPAVRDLLPRVHAAPYAGKPFADDDPFDAEVKVTLSDGRTFSEKVDRPLGRTSDNPISPEHLKAKFENCASRVLTPQAAAAVCRRIDSFEESGSMLEVTRLLEPAAVAAKPVEQAAKRGVA
ncbi:MAG: MmgE/PrpD family protein [Betaproteobacteria bacterium]|nr:MmgE/PrpD family protein [Betaproteobacteria bacterium]MDH3438338.1 MmgE/PrpD family protein [Betaproteobacteria bacterium]